MSDKFSLPHSIDPYLYLQIAPNDDGTLTRNYSNLPSSLQRVAATLDPDDHQTIAVSKDVTINKSNDLSVRIFLPREALDSSSSTNKIKLPVVIYFHGGGFILFSVGTSMTHDFCSNIASEFPAVVVSVDYRLAPEHRLPAAHDDAMEALHWIITTHDEWITNYADLTSCFLMGTSAGGNIVYYAGLRAAAEADNMLPLKIKGLILHSPFFGGLNRTESELRLENNTHLPLCVNDLMWELALPIGADRGHEYCDPTVGGGSKLLEQIELLGWKVMVTGCDGDPLIDRQIELAKIMKQKGVQVIIQNDDGTITRNWTNFPSTVATPNIPDDHHHTLDVLSKDVPVNQSKDTWVRIFLPCQALDPSSTAQLPLIVHFHGGGFVVLSAATSLFHDFCSNIAAKVPAVVASVEYRLAPEHRLPAAYDDAMEVLHWIKKTQEDWLHKYVDLSRCFLMGDSSGGNIAYHAGLRASAQVDDLLPLKIRGLILNYPFFGGVKRTESELRLVNDPFLPLCVNDLMWELALPIGVDRDNEYCNPTMGGGSKLLDHIRMLGWNVMVSGSSEDPLIDRQIEFIKMMERKGVKVICHLDQGGKHGFDDSDPVTAAKRRAVLDCIKDFVLSSADDRFRASE